MSNPIRVKYSARDFDTLVDDLTFRLKERYGDDYNDFVSSSMGSLLVDIMSYALDQMAWYQDRRATESFLETALNRSSVSRLTRPLGYQMRPATSATTELSVAPEDAQDFEWRVYAGFQFQGPEGLVFEALEDVIWSAGETATKSVLVREGRTRTTSSTSSGSENQEVRLTTQSEANVVDGSVRVFVDGEEWSELDFLEFSETNTYEVHYHEEPPVIRFGNGIAGNIPISGGEIRVTYVVNNGSKGNVASNSIVGVVQPLVVRFTDIALTVTNSVGSTGGADLESMEEAKAKAPKFFATRGVAVTQQDYESLSLSFSDPQYGAVAAANAFVARALVSDFIGTTLIGGIEVLIDDYQVSIAVDAASVSASLALVDAEVATAVADALLLDEALVTIDGAVATGLDALFLIETDDLLGRIQTQSQQILGTAVTNFDYEFDEVTDLLQNIITEGTTAYVASATAAKASLVDEWKPAITSMGTSANTYQGTIQGASATLRTVLQSVSVESGLSQGYSANIQSDLTSVSAESSTSQATMAQIDAAITQHQASIDADFITLKAHYESILSADCKANLITVPILTFDSDEFYVGPSAGLRSRLESYLQGVSDVAHSVRVVDGSTALVAADVTVQIKILESSIFSEVSSDIDTDLRLLLKKRRFGVGLYLSTVYDLIEAVDGVDYFDVDLGTLDGDGGDNDLDSRGNILVDPEHVITLGTITITEKTS